MAAAVPPAAPPPKPVTPTIAPPAPPAPPPPLAGEISDAGGSKRESVRALRWKVDGASKVLGDVEVDAAELHGLISVRGGLKARNLASDGTLDVGGPVDVAETLTTAGDASFGAAARVGAAETRGSLTVASDLTAMRSVRAQGAVSVGGNVIAPRLEFDGRLEVTGAIAVTDFVGRLKGRSRATTVQADRVTVRRGGLAARHATLEVLTIETKDADLEGVVAEYVRADRIVVGAGCQIARVDGNVLRVHPTSHVGPVSHTPAPYGLTR